MVLPRFLFLFSNIPMVLSNSFFQQLHSLMIRLAWAGYTAKGGMENSHSAVCGGRPECPGPGTLLSGCTKHARLPLDPWPSGHRAYTHRIYCCGPCPPPCVAILTSGSPYWYSRLAEYGHTRLAPYDGRTGLQPVVCPEGSPRLVLLAGPM